MIRSNIVLTFVLLLLSCASTPKQEMTVTERDYAIPFEEAWAATVEVLETEMWPIETKDEKSGLITTQYMQVGTNRDEYACQNMWPRGKRRVDDMRCKLKVRVVSIGDKVTKIQVDAQIQGRMVRSMSREGNEHIVGWIDCESTGKIEHETLESILSRI